MSSTFLHDTGVRTFSWTNQAVNPRLIRYSQGLKFPNDCLILFGFGIYKYADDDGTEIALAGAKFVLERNSAYATFTTEANTETGAVYYMVNSWVDDIDSAGTLLTSDEGGMIRIEGLDDDTYSIAEISAPYGYKIIDETITVVIDEAGSLTVNGNSGSKETITGHVVNVENEVETSEEPGEPKIPNIPDEPETPDTPEKPEGPEKPEIPDKPSEPETPEEPSEPETPETPNDVEESETPETPAEPESSDSGSDLPQTGARWNLVVCIVLLAFGGTMLVVAGRGVMGTERRKRKYEQTLQVNKKRFRTALW